MTFSEFWNSFFLKEELTVLRKGQIKSLNEKKLLHCAHKFEILYIFMLIEFVLGKMCERQKDCH